MPYCLNCHVELKGKHQKKFCSRSCSASFTNPTKKRKEPKRCKHCGKEIVRQNIYCNKKCKDDFYYEKWINEWKDGKVSGNTGVDGLGVSRHVRRYLFEITNNECSKCGWSEVNEFTGKIPLQINHVDGDWKRTSPDNVELICPNCHSLTKYHTGKLNGGRHVVEKKRLLENALAGGEED